MNQSTPVNPLTLESLPAIAKALNEFGAGEQLTHAMLDAVWNDLNRGIRIPINIPCHFDLSGKQKELEDHAVNDKIGLLQRQVALLERDPGKNVEKIERRLDRLEAEVQLIQGACTHALSIAHKAPAPMFQEPAVADPVLSAMVDRVARNLANDDLKERQRKAVETIRYEIWDMCMMAIDQAVRPNDSQDVQIGLDRVRLAIVLAFHDITRKLEEAL